MVSGPPNAAALTRSAHAQHRNPMLATSCSLLQWNGLADLQANPLSEVGFWRTFPGMSRSSKFRALIRCRRRCTYCASAVIGSSRAQDAGAMPTTSVYMAQRTPSPTRIQSCLSPKVQGASRSSTPRGQFCFHNTVTMPQEGPVPRTRPALAATTQAKTPLLRTFPTPISPTFSARAWAPRPIYRCRIFKSHLMAMGLRSPSS